MMLNMVAAGREAVASTVTDEADISTWLAGEDTTVRLVAAVVAGCRESPSLNTWFDARTEMLRQHGSVHLAIALETDDGLFAPVVRDVGTLRAEEIRRELETIKADVAGRSIARSALKGATFTLSNFGMYGGQFASLVIVPPQVGILGAGQARDRIVARNGAPALRCMLPLSLSFDHRVVTGLEALRFLNAAKAVLEAPSSGANEEQP
jgi:pyruvate dehydrogenase E2 component (dihydrolipoamide acetyltransferase)